MKAKREPRPTVQQTVRDAVRQHKSSIDDLRMTPQERNIWQHHLNNLQNIGTGGVRHPDGSISTVMNAIITGPNGKQYNIPTVWGGKILDLPQAAEMAAQAGWDMWPSADDWHQLESRYQQMHKFME